MKYVKLGSEWVSAVGLGTWQFGEPGWGWGRDLLHEEALRIVDRALELGINFFDTAAVYGNGRSEEVLGEALKGRRQDAIIATKIEPPLGPDRVKRRAERSLKNLGIDHIDLYQLHAPDNSVPISQTMEAMRDLVDRGYVKQVGVSNFGPIQWQRAEDALGLPIVSNQVEYHLLQRRWGEESLPHARQQGYVVMAWSPLAQGLLSGKYGSNNIPQDLRSSFGIFNRDNLRKAPAVVEALGEVGRRHKATPAQVALAWLLRDPNVMVIPGARSVEQLEANAAAANLELSTEDAQLIERAARR